MNGPQAVPFRQFVLKVHSRCDLACDHCYMYEHVDQGWLAQPKAMTLDTAELIGARVAEHAKTYGLDSIRFVLHGGEPLLCGAGHLDGIIRTLRRTLDGTAAVDLRIHTNGVRLDKEFLDVFAAHGVLVGVSLDGDRVANDRHRRYRDGRSSHAQVQRALGLLRRPEYRHLYAGILCTIDLDSDPIAVYEALLAEEPPNVGLLLPHSTWDAPPKRPAETAYADWLIAVWERWTADARPMGIRIFESVASTLRGGPSLSDAVGLAPSDVLVVETDGSIEMLDTLKVTYQGAAVTGLNVLADGLDAAMDHPGVRARQNGLTGLSQTCRECPVVQSCGGGLYPHRYSSRADPTAGRTAGFENPSVFCEDLRKLILHIAEAGDIAGAEPHHVIAGETLAALASGLGGAEAVGELSAALASVARELLAAASDALVPRFPAARSAWRVLTHVDAENPAALAEVLAHPYFRAWAVKVLSGADQDGDEEHLTAVAVAAAIRAGVPAELTLTPRAGLVYLPTLGTLEIDGPQDRSGMPVRVSSTESPGVFTVANPGDPTDARTQSVIADREGQTGWEPTAAVSSGGFVVRLEDGDPERRCHQWPTADRLSEPDRRRWQECFDQAWRLIERDFPGYAPGLRAGLNTLTPLAPHPGGHEISATARQAPGAVAAALPDSPDRLALLMIHEFQHVKLGAVLDCFDLYDETEDRQFYAPWRDDPRPFEGLFQGTYAHIGVADYWRIRRTRASGAERELAETQFARWREQTASAIETLAGSGALTALGESFVAGMRAAVAPWLDEPVEAAAAAAARDWAARHWSAHPLASAATAQPQPSASGTVHSDV